MVMLTFSDWNKKKKLSIKTILTNKNLTSSNLDPTIIYFSYSRNVKLLCPKKQQWLVLLLLLLLTNTSTFTVSVRLIWSSNVKVVEKVMNTPNINCWKLTNFYLNLWNILKIFTIWILNIRELIKTPINIGLGR